MGVRGLLKYIRSSKSTIKLDSVRLFKRGDEKLFLVCDLIAVFYWLIELLHNAKVSAQEYSKYSCIYGGDFNDYRERVLEFVEALRFVNVEPIFFRDGPHGSEYDYAMKLDTWKERAKKTLAKVKTNAEICKFHAAEIKFEKRIKQTLLFEELVCALRDAKVTVIQCEGEADNAMAEFAREHSDVCAILTNDTDMALMSGCKMVHYKFFDRKDTLEFYRPTLKRSHEICCDIMKPQYLARDLKIDEKCLPALAILTGNDFTRNINDKIKLKDLLGFGWPIIVSCAVWIKYHEKDCMAADTFVSIKQIKEICDEYPEYHAAIFHSYDFYQSKKSISKSLQSPVSPLYNFIAEEVKNHEMHKNFLSFAKTGVVWRSEIEQLDERMPCIHEILQPARKLMYKLLCVPHITEYGQLGVDGYTKVEIDVNPCKVDTISALRDLPFDQKVVLVFNALLNCQVKFGIEKMNDDSVVNEIFLLKGIVDQKILGVDLKDSDSDEAEDFFRATLTCVCLLFAVKCNLVCEPYITPLIMTCFCCTLGRTPPKLAARPGPTGVTIASQFMVILQHARLIASLLGLHIYLPLPSTIFQPFVYIPLHGTAFKFSQKEKFHGDDVKIKNFYDNMSTNRSFRKFKNLVTSADSFATIMNEYINTKRDLLQVSASSKLGTAGRKK